MRTGRNSSAPGGLSLDTIEAFSSKLLMTLQQFKMQESLSLGALYIFIFCSSFCASCTKRKQGNKIKRKERNKERSISELHQHDE